MTMNDSSALSQVLYNGAALQQARNCLETLHDGRNLINMTMEDCSGPSQVLAQW
jgi:hypothetical protein